MGKHDVSFIHSFALTGVSGLAPVFVCSYSIQSFALIVFRVPLFFDSERQSYLIQSNTLIAFRVPLLFIKSNTLI